MENDEVREDIAIWQDQPLTRKFAKTASVNALELHAQLMSTCASSIDPKVAGAYGVFCAWNDMAKDLGGKHVRIGE